MKNNEFKRMSKNGKKFVNNFNKDKILNKLYKFKVMSFNIEFSKK